MPRTRLGRRSELRVRGTARHQVGHGKDARPGTRTETVGGGLFGAVHAVLCLTLTGPPVPTSGV